MFQCKSIEDGADAWHLVQEFYQECWIRNSWHITFKSLDKVCFSSLKAMAKYKVFIRLFFFLRFLSAKFCFSSIFVVYLPSLSRWFFLSMSFFLHEAIPLPGITRFNAIQFYCAHNPPARIAANINVEFDILLLLLLPLLLCHCFCSSFRLYRFFNQPIEHLNVTIYGLCTRYAWKGFHFQTICFQFE